MGNDFIDVEMQLLKEENVRLEGFERKVLKQDQAQELRDRNAALRAKFHQPEPSLLAFMSSKAKGIGFIVK